MLLKIAPHIAECLERARASHERAMKEKDATLRADFLAIEQHWLRLAESYRGVERMDACSEAERLRAMMESQSSDVEVEHLAERMVGKPPKPPRSPKRSR